MSSEINNTVPADDAVIRVSHVSKIFEMYEKPRHRLQQMMFGRWKRWYKEFRALDDVSFEIRRGECVGIIGRNGSGKSTILQIITGTLQPTTGSVWIKPGLRVAALLELGSGFNPEFTGRENVYLNASILGLSKEQTDAKFQEIADFADIGEFIDQPVKTYSSGMMVRLAFSVQIMTDPDILIIDEALAVGDAAFQKKCLEAMGRLFRDKQRTIIFVSHSQEVVQSLCSRSILMKKGNVMFDGNVEDAFQTYNTQGAAALSPVELNLADFPRSQSGMPMLVKFMSFKVLNKQESRFLPEEKLRFEITMYGLDDCEGFWIRLIINSMQQNRPVTMTSTAPDYSIRKGETKRYEFEMDISTLAPTWYTLNLRFSKYMLNEQNTTFDRLDNAYIFTVEPSKEFFHGRRWEPAWWGNIKLPGLIRLFPDGRNEDDAWNK